MVRRFCRVQRPKCLCHAAVARGVPAESTNSFRLRIEFLGVRQRSAVPSVETDLPAPHSPYGVTKLAAEHLCVLYAKNWGIPTTCLRYFTVYGPRQRPDMAMTRLVSAVLTGDVFPLNGDGQQVRDFTFVGDAVAANIAAASADCKPGTVLNIAGGVPVTMNEVIRELEIVAGRSLGLEHLPDQAGDVRETGGSIDLAVRLLGWKPQVSLRAGLTAHVEWMKTTSTMSIRS